MSFFDDDEPDTRHARPAAARRAAPLRGAPRGDARALGGRRPGPATRQQLMVRRAVALGVGALVLILLVSASRAASTAAPRTR